MNMSASSVPGVFHFSQHNGVLLHNWQRLCQAIGHWLTHPYKLPVSPLF
jgi:hypothetical protein